jgi:homogentisate 1,2-dioxygenase
MPLYHKLGNFPQKKRHTQFENQMGGLYYEQLFGTEGFHGNSSLVSCSQPTQVRKLQNHIL